MQNNSGDMYSYDAEGNLSQRQTQTLGNTTYRWDAENRLIALEDSDHPATRSEFHYDALGRRIGIQDFSNGISQRDDRFIYCGSRLCAKRETQSDQFIRYYINAASQNNMGRYYHNDHLGSIRVVTDNTGVTLASYSYDPYGRQTTLSGQADSSDFGYTGHYHHAASGLALAPYRAYDADIGRWLSRDPIGEAGGINIYAYVGNNPVNAVDPLGLTQKDIDAARSIATRSQPDLRFPNSYGSRDLGYTENGRRITGLTIPGFGTILDDQYQKPLSDQRACELLNTIIHEGVHFTLKPDDRRQDDENGSGYPYTEGDRRTTTPILLKKRSIIEVDNIDKTNI